MVFQIAVVGGLFGVAAILAVLRQKRISKKPNPVHTMKIN